VHVLHERALFAGAEFSLSLHFEHEGRGNFNNVLILAIVSWNFSRLLQSTSVNLEKILFFSKVSFHGIPFF
jgi:hypothetical protein